MTNLDTIGWYALAIPLYVVYVSCEYVLARRRPEYSFTFTETISNLTAGLGTLLIGLFTGPCVLYGWNLIHDRIAPLRWPEHGVWKIPAAVLLGDFCYYIYHRAGHRYALFWSIHAVHHQHEHFNSSVGYRLEWLADPFTALFFCIMPLCGVDATTGFIALALLSAFAGTTHSPVLPRPSWGIFVTPTIHGAHHSRDARFVNKNFASMFSFWDRMFGTWLEPEKNQPLRTDLPSICRTHNAVRTQWGILAELWRSLRARPTLLGKLSSLFEWPTVSGPPTPLRTDAELTRSTRIYVFLHFLLLVPFSGWVLWFREIRPLWVQLLCSTMVIAGLYTLGMLLDGHPRARDYERRRLTATALVGIGFAFYAPWVGILLLVFALGSLVHSLSLPDERQPVPSAGVAR